MNDALSESRWTPLLRRLTALDPRLAVYKNSDRALRGEGDVDLLAPEERWEEIEVLFAEWCASNEMIDLPACRHRPWALYLIGVDRGEGRLMQLDVRSRVLCRRAELFEAHRTEGLLDDHELAFRVFRAGAEGATKLFLRAIGSDGELLAPMVSKYGIDTQIRSDPEGAMVLADRSAVGGAVARSTVQMMIDGSWDVSVARETMESFRRASWRDAGTLLTLGRGRWSRKHCRLLRHVLVHGDERPEDLDEWIAAVDHTHPAATR